MIELTDLIGKKRAKRVQKLEYPNNLEVDHPANQPCLGDSV